MFFSGYHIDTFTVIGCRSMRKCIIHGKKLHACLFYTANHVLTGQSDLVMEFLRFSVQVVILFQKQAECKLVDVLFLIIIIIPNEADIIQRSLNLQRHPGNSVWF